MIWIQYFDQWENEEKYKIILKKAIRRLKQKWNFGIWGQL